MLFAHQYTQAVTNLFTRSQKTVALASIVALLLSMAPLGSVQFAQAAPPETLFETDFEEAGDLTGWTTTGEWFENDWGVDGSRAGTVVGPTTGGTQLRKVVSTEGYEDITLSFDYRIRDTKIGEAGDVSRVQWYDGESWTTIVDYSQTSQDAWTAVSFDLPDGAEDNADFQFRFVARFTDNSEDDFDDLDHFRVDNVVLSGHDIHETFRVSGYKFEDADGSGEIDISEPVDDWRISVFDDEDTLVDSVFTGDGEWEDGYYEFALEPGTYTVCEAHDEAWMQTYPHDALSFFGDSIGLAECDAYEGEAAFGYTIVVDDEALEDLDFGNFKFGKISGVKWDEARGEEYLVAGWELFLIDPENEVHATTTDENGRYWFTDLRPGVHHVCEAVVATTTESGTENVCVAHENQLVPDPEGERVYRRVNISSGTGFEEEPRNFNFINDLEDSITAFKFFDVNGNGIQDRRDEPLADWEICLLADGEGSENAVCGLTDENGEYTWDDLERGDYIVFETIQEGWSPTTGDLDGSEAVTLYAGNLRVDFGNTQHAIRVIKYFDENENGCKDQGEIRLPGWEMCLFERGAEESIVCSITDENGEVYWLGTDYGLETDTPYDVIEEDRSGWTATSHPDRTARVRLDLGEKVKRFGNYSEVTRVYGSKFFDENADGMWQYGEDGLAEWTIIATPMMVVATSTYAVDESRSQKLATTTEDGSYDFMFFGDDAGLWFISEDVQDGWEQITPAEPDYYMLEVYDDEGDTHYDYNFGNWMEAMDAEETIVVIPEDMATSTAAVIEDTSKWYFYNDETDTIDNTLGSFVEGPDTPPLGVGSVEIDVEGSQRRNLATSQYSGTPLASVRALGFSTYNPSAGNGSGSESDRAGYLQFNVSFDGTDAWQSRLVFVPRENGTVLDDTWQTWDAINDGSALWWWSGYGGNGSEWPDGEEDAYRTWDSIIANFPDAKMHELYPFFGIRVGEPYSNGYTENLDNVIVGIQDVKTVTTTTFDFDPYGPVELTGSKFHDWDFDNYWDGVHGVSQTLEPGLPDWLIIATPITEEGGEEDTDGDRETKSTLTDENGDYSFWFDVLEEGWWRIAEAPQGGWTQTYPDNDTGYYDVYISPDGLMPEVLDDGPPEAPGFELLDNSYEAGYDEQEGLYEYYDFGNWEQPFVEIFKFEDENQNGTQDNEEQGEEGFLFALGQYHSDDVSDGEIPIEIVSLGLTGPDGFVHLPIPHPGQFFIFEAQHDDWVPMFPGERNDVLVPQLPEQVQLFADPFFGIVPGDSLPPIPGAEWFPVDPFFDVFVDLNTATATTTLPLPDLAQAPVDSFFDVFADISVNEDTHRVDSFFDIFVDVTEEPSFEVDSFFDIYVNADQFGQTITQGYGDDGADEERPQLQDIIFGNYYDEPETPVEETSSGGGGNGPVTGTFGVGGDASGGNGDSGGTTGGTQGGGTTTGGSTGGNGPVAQGGNTGGTGSGSSATIGGTTITAIPTSGGGVEVTLENEEGATTTLATDDDPSTQVAAAASSGLFGDVPNWLWIMLLVLLLLGAAGFYFWDRIRAMLE